MFQGDFGIISGLYLFAQICIGSHKKIIQSPIIRKETNILQFQLSHLSYFVGNRHRFRHSYLGFEGIVIMEVES